MGFLASDTSASPQMKIDPNLCAGCIQCSQVCKFGAIKRVR